MPRIVASIEARMGSSRLPGKVLADIGGVPALGRLVRRLRLARTIDDIVLATSTADGDTVLAEWAAREGVACFRGSEDDVLARVIGAHRMMGSEIVIEMCGDTPLIDPAVVDLAVDTFAANRCDIVSTTWVPSYPQGIDAQVFRLVDLAEVEATIDDAAVREHVSLYFYEHPERYRLINLMAPRALRRPAQRLQLDYAEDLRLIREIYARLEPVHGDSFGVGDIVALLDREPQLAEINRHCQEWPAR